MARSRPESLGGNGSRLPKQRQLSRTLDPPDFVENGEGVLDLEAGPLLTNRILPEQVRILYRRHARGIADPARHSTCLTCPVDVEHQLRVALESRFHEGGEVIPRDNVINLEADLRSSSRIYTRAVQSPKVRAG